MATKVNEILEQLATLRSEAERLVKLIDAGEHGLMTWWQCLGDRVRAIHEFGVDVGMIPTYGECDLYVGDDGALDLDGRDETSSKYVLVNETGRIVREVTQEEYDQINKERKNEQAT